MQRLKNLCSLHQKIAKYGNSKYYERNNQKGCHFQMKVIYS